MSDDLDTKIIVSVGLELRREDVTHVIGVRETRYYARLHFNPNPDDKIPDGMERAYVYGFLPSDVTFEIPESFYQELSRTHRDKEKRARVIFNLGV